MVPGRVTERTRKDGQERLRWLVRMSNLGTTGNRTFCRESGPRRTWRDYWADGVSTWGISGDDVWDGNTKVGEGTETKDSYPIIEGWVVDRGQREETKLQDVSTLENNDNINHNWNLCRSETKRIISLSWNKKNYPYPVRVTLYRFAQGKRRFWRERDHKGLNQSF